MPQSTQHNCIPKLTDTPSLNRTHDRRPMHEFLDRPQPKTKYPRSLHQKGNLLVWFRLELRSLRLILHLYLSLHASICLRREGSADCCWLDADLSAVVFHRHYLCGIVVLCAVLILSASGIRCFGELGGCCAIRWCGDRDSGEFFCC